VRPGVGCIPASPGTIPAIFGIMDWLIGLEVPGARPGTVRYGRELYSWQQAVSIYWK
jgi:hypothetical protein